MPENGIRSTYTQSPFQILMYDSSDRLISTGTAFTFEHKDELFLITNWHNVSGMHFLTKERLGNSIPLYIKAKLSTYVIGDAFTSVGHRIDLYKDYEPVWFEHPTMGSMCDVIALPFKKPLKVPDFMHYQSNKIAQIRIPIKPGNGCFVIGFPRSLSIGFGLPLWKSGYISSEPHYDITINGQVSEIGGLINGIDLPAIFIDTLTRAGMSGSPVFASYIGNWDMTDPYKELDPSDPSFSRRDDIAIGENRMEFIGCYSGRIGVAEEEAALGLCWKVKALEAICENKIKGKHPCDIIAE